MYFATAALASLFATIMAPSPAYADTALPVVKNGKSNHHVFETNVSFRSNKDVDGTPDQLAFVEDAIIRSCNESHDANKFHMEKMAIKKVTHGPTFEVEKTFLRASLDNYNGYTGSGDYSCQGCDPDDYLLMDLLIALTKGGKVKDWEDTLCAMLGENDDFDGANDCQIKVNWHKEE
jgi:hypothetical protein